MSRFFYVALAVFILQAVLSQAGLINKLVTGIINGNETHNYGQPGSYDERKQQSLRPGHDRDTAQSYKNTSWHIENEDYLTQYGNKSSQHKRRPSTGYGGGGTYDRRTTTSRPYERKPFHETYSVEGANTTQNNKLRIHKNEENLNHRPKAATVVTNTANISTEKTVNHSDVDIILRSDSITCCYTNVREEDVGKRKMTCNQKDCRLEKTSSKSSLWICGDIKCAVANVDFSRTDNSKKLIDCSMDGRNLITVQDKPVKCGKDEKAQNGRCRQVFGK